MVTVQADVPEGERLVRVESNVESLIRAMSEVRADIRDLRSDMKDLRAMADRNFLWTLGIIIPMWVTIIVAIVVTILVRS